jgi:hypothetical protein
MREHGREPEKLPVTAELGDEGGSYGDATLQAETFEGTAGNPRVDPKRVGSPEAGAAAGDDRPLDLVKHPDEPPDAGR